MAVFDSKTFGRLFSSYKDGQKWLNDVEVEIVGGENDIDPLTLLRLYDEEASVDNEMTLATGFCMNRVIRFTKNGQLLLEADYKGGDLADHFKGQPYLLDLLLKLSYGLMLKKLTPPSEGSESEERQ